MSDKNCLILKSPGVSTDSSLPKLENYVGIEFLRGSSDGGGVNEYHKMLGDPSLLSQMPIHNSIKNALVKDGKKIAILNQVNYSVDENGNSVVLDGTDGCDVVQTFPKMYLINGGTDPTYIRYIVSSAPFTYGNDTAVEVSSFGETPDYVTILDGKSRCIANDNVAGTQGAGFGTNYSDNSFGVTTGLGRPKFNLSRFELEGYARNKNINPLGNIPYCNATCQDLEVIMALLYIECRTRILSNVFGYGITSCATPTSSTWGTVTGVRLTRADNTTKLYYNLRDSVYVNGTSRNWSTIINNEKPLLKCLEAQKSISNGSTLESVSCPDGTILKGKEDGVMTGIWTKTLHFTLNNWSQTSSGDRENVTVDVVLRVPVWRGKSNLFGNVLLVRSGYDILNFKANSEDSIHNILFRASSSVNIMTDSDDATKESRNQFAFETAYAEVYDLGSSSGWKKEDVVNNGWNTLAAKTDGAAINNYIQSCMYLDAGAVTVGQYKRLAVTTGGMGTGQTSVIRNLFVSYPSRSSFASGFRVEL